MAPTASTSAGPSASARISSELSKLWSSDPAVRIAASAALVAHLQAASAAGSDGSDNEEISYTLRRLIRGLASPRESSRLGFAVALTELLARLSSVIHIRQVLPVLLESSQLGNGLRGQEERDFLFSRLFGIHAVVASGLIFAAASSLHDWQVTIEETVYLGERKAWLRESAGWVVQLAARELLAKTSEQVAWREDGLKAVVRALFINKPDPSSSSASNGWTPEKLAMAVMLQETDVEADWATFTAPTFASPELLSSAANIPAISRILKGMSASASSKRADEQAQSVFFGNGQLHYVWREILQAYFPSLSTPATTSEKPKKKKSKVAEPASDKVPFLDFYTAAVEESLLGNSSASSGKYVGLVAFEACLAAAPSDIAPLLLTPNLLRTLMNHLSKGDRTLHGIANKVARSIPTACHKDPSIGFDVLMKLFNPPYGNTRFDAMTRTKTVEGVVASLDLDAIVRYAEWLVNFILEADQAAASGTDDGAQPDGMDVDGDDKDSGSKKIENKRSWAVDQLLLLVRKHSSPLPRTEDAAAAELPAWTLRILEFFALHGFFNLHKATKKGPIGALKSKPDTPFTPATQTLFRSRFLSALTHLVTINPKCRGEPWTERALATLEALSKEEKYLSMLGADEEAIEERQATAKLLSKLSKNKDQQRAKPMAFLIQVLLLLSYDPEDDIVENLEELRDATEALFFPTKNGKAANGDEEDGEEAEPISVLIDLLVTLLQKPSAFVRTTAERVFTAFSGEVKEQALQLLLDQISPDSTVEVEEPTAGRYDEAEAAAVPNGKSAEDGSDDDSDDDDDSDSGDEDDEDLGIDLDADPELRAKVEAALRGVGMAVDEDEDEDDEDDADGAEEEEEEILDDEQMLELDDQLAEIFRAKKAQSKGNKADQEAALNSRLKVLDLLEHFAKAQPGNILVVDTVLPLLNVARRSSSEDKELAAKAGRVLRGIVQKSKEYPSSTEVGALLPTLTAVHAAAQRASSPEALALASATSLYLCRIILGETGVRNSQEVIAVYQASLSDYLVRKQSRIQPKLFTDFIQRFKTAAWALKDALLVASSEQTTTKDKHKRCQALHLVAEVMAAHSSLKTDQAKAEVVAFAPEVASNVIAIFTAAADGSTTQLNATRLKEVFKATMQAVRATRSCIPKGSKPPVWTVWKVEELCSVLAQFARSDKADKPASLNASSRQLLDAVLEGSGRQKVKDPANGLPPLTTKAVNGKQERKKAKQDKAAAAPVAASAVKRKSAELHNDTSSDSEDE